MNQKIRSACFHLDRLAVIIKNKKMFGFKGVKMYLCRAELERCQSGRMGRTRNAVNGQLFRGFESLSFRAKT